MFLTATNLSSQINSSSFKFSPSVLNLNPTAFQLNLNSNKNYWNSDNFSVYNSITNLNDNYYSLGQKYHLSGTKSFSNFGFEGQRIDSFNPYGTKDFGTALATGALNLLLGKF